MILIFFYCLNATTTTTTITKREHFYLLLCTFLKQTENKKKKGEFINISFFIRENNIKNSLTFCYIKRNQIANILKNMKLFVHFDFLL